MARSRQIKPGFFKNEHLVALPFSTRLLFAGLWTLADKAGRLEDRPLKIKMELFPADAIDIDAALNELANAPEPFIVRYESQGVRIIQVVKWEENQKPHHQEAESNLPGLDEIGTTSEQVRTLARSGSDKGAKRSVKVTSNKQQVINKEVVADELDRIDNPDVKAAVGDWLAYKRERKQSYGETALKKFVSRVVTLAARDGPASVVEKFDRAISQRYDGWDFDGTNTKKAVRDNSGRGAGSRERGL